MAVPAGSSDSIASIEARSAAPALLSSPDDEASLKASSEEGRHCRKTQEAARHPWRRKSPWNSSWASSGQGCTDTVRG
jgi:hypothetical protein